MKTFLFLGGLATSISGVAFGTSLLISAGINEAFCYLIYLAALVVITAVANYVNSNVFGWYDDEYKPLDYYDYSNTHRLTK